MREKLGSTSLTVDLKSQHTPLPYMKTEQKPMKHHHSSTNLTEFSD